MITPPFSSAISWMSWVWEERGRKREREGEREREEERERERGREKEGKRMSTLTIPKGRKGHTYYTGMLPVSMEGERLAQSSVENLITPYRR